jgi:ATP-dependent protease Clp ATPase subunit
VPGPGDIPSCSFCGKNKEQAEVMIGVPQAYICDQCVSRVHAVMAELGGTASTPIATIGQVSAGAGEQRCRFCGKSRHQVAATASAGDTRICNECLELCDEVLSEVPPVPSR